MRCARTWYEPAAKPGMRNLPDSSVRAPRLVQTRDTLASASAALVPATVTVPSMAPVVCARAPDANPAIASVHGTTICTIDDAIRFIQYVPRRREARPEMTESRGFT